MIIVGVYGFLAAEYTVTLTSSSAATLLRLGAVQSGTVATGQLQYYRVLLSQQSSLAPYTLRLAVTPYSGRVQVFIACDTMLPNATSAQWSFVPTPGSGSHIDILSIAAVDKGCLRVGAQYYASVYGDAAASYSVLATVLGNSTVPLLVPGLATSSEVQSQHFDYYFVRPPGAAAANYDDIRLLATVLQGDVDLYISTTWDTRPRLNPYTNAVQSYVLSSAKSGSEDMTINHDWILDACAQRTSCYFIVGVFALRPASTSGSTVGSSRSSLLARTPDATIQLSSGVPRQSHVTTNRFEYFKYTLTQPGVDVIISVTPISGDPGEFGLGSEGGSARVTVKMFYVLYIVAIVGYLLEMLAIFVRENPISL